MELKKIQLELEIQKVRAGEKMISTHQKRKMFAAERKLKREQKEETDEQIRLRVETVSLCSLSSFSDEDFCSGSCMLNEPFSIHLGKHH